MKNCIITLLALFACLDILAQTDKGCLIVKEYSPDEWQVISFSQQDWYTIKTQSFDMDDDGQSDFCYYCQINQTHRIELQLYASHAACSYCIDSTQYPGPYYPNFFVDLNTPLNDSSLNYLGTIMLPEKRLVGEIHLDTVTYKTAIRNGQEGEYYYGWLEAHYVINYGYNSVRFYLARTGYCTIPNYPLRWGQTSLTDGIEEIESPSFANVYPNPAKGQVTILGKDLETAEVVNMLGQRVATASGKSEYITMDISHLPAGIYFVNITDSEGRKCVRKVVKE